MASRITMNKRTRASVETAVVDISRREVGRLPTRKFAHRLAASQDLVMRLHLARKLEKHRGCVNTVSFNPNGDILVSGSDDRRVVFWDWENGRIKLCFDSGHSSNIFQAKIMPETDDRSIVTCAADGQVRHATILESGKVETKLLAKHQGRAHKLASEPGSPHVFYSCGEDGLVQQFDLRTGDATELFTCQPVHGRPFMQVVNLNAIAIDPRNPNLFVTAGSDEFTRLYDIRRYSYNASSTFGEPADHFCPNHLIGDENVGITGLSFSDQSELVVSYCEEFIYIFNKDMGLGNNINEVIENHVNDSSDSEMETYSKSGPLLFKGHRNCRTVKGVGFYGPNSEYVLSGSDCGRMFIWRKEDAVIVRVMEADKHVVNCIQPHPHTPMLASCGIDKDVKIWTPTAHEKAPPPTNIEKLKPMTNTWMYHLASPRDMELESLVVRSHQTSPVRSRIENAAAEAADTMDFIFNFGASSSDEDDSEEVDTEEEEEEEEEDDEEEDDEEEEANSDFF